MRLFQALMAVHLCSYAFAGSEAHLFVPNQYAPLSSFKLKSTTTLETLTFAVKPQVLQHIISNGAQLWVAFQSSTGVITLKSVTSYNGLTGAVTLSTNQKGKYVVVGAPFTNDLPVVTHWRQSLNSGRGGFELGATDGIGSINFNPATLQISESTDIYDNDPISPYTFNSAKYALFANDPFSPNARVPGYERYIGENYSTYKITDLMATYLSLKSLEQTGYPLLHRNHPWALYDGAPAAKKVAVNLPAFQVVHNFVSTPEVDKPSLATFILPPGWSKTAALKYPIIFNAQYDSNQNFSQEHGLDVIQVIADLQKNGVGSSIGVLWNGGGAIGPLGVQPSIYYGAAFLFYLTDYYFRGDTFKVITMGKSRGGITALTVAANPNFDNYKVKYAMSYAPAPKVGEIASKFDLATSYAGLHVPLTWSTGYKYAYQKSFIDPLTNLNGRQLLLKNITGSTDAAMADAMSPNGDWLLGGMKTRGVNVLHSAGTHDAFIPYTVQVEYHDRLVAAGVPTQFDIGFRFGHNYFTDKKAQIYKVMREVMLGTNAPLTGIHYFQRASETGTGFDQGVETTPVAPIFAELPKQVFRNQSLRLVIAGAKGVAYSLVYFKIDDALWANSKQLAVVDQGNALTSNLFAGNSSLQSQTLDVVVPSDMATGHYVFVLVKSTDYGATSEIVDISKIPQNVMPRLPVFEVLATEPTMPSLDLNSLLNIGDRGWGISSN